MIKAEEKTMRDEMQARFWEEYREYIKATPMTAYERRLLRKWVSECHSVYDDPGSRYLGCSAYPMPFLDVYRMDREFEHEMKGMSPDEKIEYLKKATGWDDPSPGELAMDEAKMNTPKLIEALVRQLERDFFHLREFVMMKGFAEEAMQYVRDLKDEEIPFEW